MIRHYIDEVSWNDTGNEIQLVMKLSRKTIAEETMPPELPPAKEATG